MYNQWLKTKEKKACKTVLYDKIKERRETGVND